MTGNSSWKLNSLSAELGGKQFEIHGSMTVGRSQESDICIALIGMSRRHATITVSEEGLLVEDLKSSNGTFINNTRVDTGIARNGDTLGFDTLKFAVSGPELDLYSDKTTVHAVPQQLNAPPKGPTAIDKQKLILKRLPPRRLVEFEDEDTFLKRFLESEWSKLLFLLLGLGTVLGVVYIVSTYMGR